MVLWFPASTGARSGGLIPVEIDMASDSREFVYFVLAPGLVNQEFFSIGNTPFEVLRNGHIIATSVYYSQALVAGSISVEPLLNGVVIPNVALNLTISSAIPAQVQRDRKNIAEIPDFQITAGDLISFRVSTLGSLNPSNRELIVAVHVYYS